MSKLYFAYGANTNLDNMKHRCPKAKLVGNIILPNWELCFRNVADIERKNNSKVYGVLWEITDDCEFSLDIYEGYPHLYRKEYFPVRIKDTGEITDVMFYKMNSNQYGKPNESYYQTIRMGYLDNDLPLNYLDKCVKKTLLIA